MHRKVVESHFNAQALAIPLFLTSFKQDGSKLVEAEHSAKHGMIL